MGFSAVIDCDYRVSDFGLWIARSTRKYWASDYSLMMQNRLFQLPYAPTQPIIYPPVFPRNENPQICTSPKARKPLIFLRFWHITHQITATFFFMFSICSPPSSPAHFCTLEVIVFFSLAHVRKRQLRRNMEWFSLISVLYIVVISVASTIFSISKCKLHIRSNSQLNRTISAFLCKRSHKK
jgi:hypothetical protein